MTLLLPDTVERCSLEVEHPFLTEIVLIMNSCFIQYTALPVKTVNVAQKINSFCQE